MPTASMSIRSGRIWSPRTAAFSRPRRKNTAASRDTVVEELREKQTQLEKENMLMKKDVDNLTSETGGIKEDIKEMKATLNQMAISLTKIAAKYEFDSEKEKAKR